MRFFLFLFVQLIAFTSWGQIQNPADVKGILIGVLIKAENSKAVEGATITLSKMNTDSMVARQLSQKDGSFSFDKLSFGLYRLTINSIGHTILQLDSIFIREERYDFDLNEIKLNSNTTTLKEVIIFAEKPLIENKDGKVIFNVGESALSSTTSATELLKQTPLVNVDNDGKLLLRGKEVKVLIDDKPVELSARQLQDMLESMPGSMIEKIEIMTTPPPQYANERGGVINIVTKKGKTGFNGRLNMSYGTRGEAGLSGNLTYRKNKIVVNINAGFGYNEFTGDASSTRQNIYADSSNYFLTNGNTASLNRRPNFRLSLDYELNKRNSFNFTTSYNANRADNSNITTYKNLNNLSRLYNLSNRATTNDASTYNPNFNISYTLKAKDPREVLKIITGLNINDNNTVRGFYQQYFNPDYLPNGIDSTQQQVTAIRNHTFSIRLNYDKPLRNKKMLINLGGNVIRYNSHNVLTTNFWRKPANVFVKSDLLSNDFEFYQNIISTRASLRYDIKQGYSITIGTAFEHTRINFDFKNNANSFKNDYVSILPFATLNRKWENDVSLTFSYKRTLQRPGINELNPSVDYGDPYNTRFGNPLLLPYTADNFDFIMGKWKKNYNINASVGFNILEDIYSSIRTLQTDGKTTTTWQNLSGRKEYEASAWGGYTVSKKVKINLSLGYIYNVYSSFDRTVKLFRNGGSLFSTLNGSWQFNDLLNASANFTFNRFANPQGTVRNNLSMNIGVQRKLLDKKFIVSLNIIDPFRQQRNQNYTVGSNFILESTSSTNTRNYRLGVSYLFSKKVKKVVRK